MAVPVAVAAKSSILLLFGGSGSGSGTATATGTRVGRPPHSMPSNARIEFGGTGRALAEFHMPNDYLASDLPGYAAATRSCHAALPTPPWRRPRLEGAQCPARRDRCLPHHHPRRAARAQDPRCATRRAARALPPRQPPPLPSGTSPPPERRARMQNIRIALWLFRRRGGQSDGDIVS